jgi:predicted DNA-binding transcriptional regulator YafY
MRADRLLSMLMLLETRGRMTAQELSEKLEVSERTIYRDVNALSFAGVPIYAERGPNGGISLIESFKSDLTGLTRDEVRALFMVSIPPALTDLGLDQDLRAAMLKLSAALPSTLRSDEVRTMQRIHIDPAPWRKEHSSESVPHLQTVQKAVWESKVLAIQYRSMLGPNVGLLDANLQPYGVVAKAGVWNVVAKRKDHIAVVNISHIEQAQILDETFRIPEDFDLVKFWKAWCEGIEKYQYAFPVKMRIAPSLIPKLPYFFGEGIRESLQQCGNPDEDGWITVEIPFESHEEARGRLLRFGGVIEVLEPIALRFSLKDYAEQIIGVYSDEN